jgi:putative pre-16S rRNA nuclease
MQIDNIAATRHDAEITLRCIFSPAPIRCKTLNPYRGHRNAAAPRGAEGLNMAAVSLSEMKAALAPGSRLLGLDLGEKTIGLALSDTLLTVATPMETWKRGKFTADAEKLDRIVADHKVGGLVVGLPLNMDGSEGPSAQSARAFARNFAARSTVPIVLCDERLSTAAVTRTLLEADASRLRRAAVVDKMAAAYILQGALDRLRHLGAS